MSMDLRDMRGLLALVRDLTGIDIIARPRSAPITARVHSARRISVHSARALAADPAPLLRLLGVTRTAYGRLERDPLTPSEAGAVDIIVTRLRQRANPGSRNTFRDD